MMSRGFQNPVDFAQAYNSDCEQRVGNIDQIARNTPTQEIGIVGTRVTGNPNSPQPAHFTAMSASVSQQTNTGLRALPPAPDLPEDRRTQTPAMNRLQTRDPADTTSTSISSGITTTRLSSGTPWPASNRASSSGNVQGGPGVPLSGSSYSVGSSGVQSNAGTEENHSASTSTPTQPNTQSTQANIPSRTTLHNSPLAPPNIAHPPSSIPPAPSSSSSDGTQETRSSALSEQQCRVCMDAKADVVFVPCGHMCCASCSKQLTVCPFCRQNIRATVRPILS